MNDKLDEEIDPIEVLRKLFGEVEIKKGDRLISALYDSIFEVMKWTEILPYLQFPAHWQVKITPPFIGANIRFRVKKATTPPNFNVSIYFDGYNGLGHFGEPYWEIYPDFEGNNARFTLGEEDKMFQEIEKALDKLENKNAT